MTAESSRLPPELTDQTWYEIEDLVGAIARLSQADISPSEFYRQLLDHTVRALAAVGGAIWTRRPGGDVCLEYQVNLDKTGLGESRRGQWQHGKLVELVLRTGQPQLALPRSAQAPRDEAANPTEFTLLLSPWSLEGKPVGVVEIVQRAELAPAAQQGCVQFLASLCELAAHFHCRRELRQLRAGQESWQQFTRFVEQIHRSLDVRATAYAIANEGRELIGCDRLSVLILQDSRCRLMALSGVHTFDRRANSVRRLEQLATALVAADEPFWYRESATQVPPQIEPLLHEHIDGEHLRGLGVIPLKERPPEDVEEALEAGRAFGALVVEQFQGGQEAEIQRRVESVRVQSAVALARALEHDRLPLRPLLETLAGVGWVARLRRLPTTWLVCLALLAALLALVLVPAEFTVPGQGELQPEHRRDVFAPSDGVIVDLPARHGQQVAAGQVLAELRRAELDYEFQRVTGEIQTAQKKLASIQAMRLERLVPGSAAAGRYQQWAAEEQELQELLKSLHQQQQILKRQQAELTVRSPLDGHVLTWDVTHLLEARPVRRGQTLFTVADLEGPWVLELRLADDRVGHVLAAQQQQGPNLPVSFLLQTDPGVAHRGTLRQVAMATEMHQQEEPTVLLTVDVQREQIPHLRPGARLRARIHCGRRPIGYVWFHGLIEAIQSRVLF